MVKRMSLVILAVFLCGAIVNVGCEEKAPPGATATKGVPAQMLHPNVQAYDPLQKGCPVCGGRPLKKEYYYDVKGKGRIYFDRQECLEKFEGSPDRYLKDFKTGAQRRQEAYEAMQKKAQEKRGRE